MGPKILEGVPLPVIQEQDRLRQDLLVQLSGAQHQAREADRRIQDADRRVQEADRRVEQQAREADRRVQEAVEQLVREADRRVREADLRVQDADRRVEHLERHRSAAAERNAANALEIARLRALLASSEALALPEGNGNEPGTFCGARRKVLT